MIEIIGIVLSALIVIFAIVFHECAHGWAAYKLGDPTAKLAGRLTLNPIKHIDLFGTLILPGVLLALRFMGLNTIVFGWAKPVPVNFLQLNNPKRDMIFVAFAGPLVNIFFALCLSRVFNFFPSSEFRDVVEFGIFANLFLAAFNLIPIPPLDGSRILAGLLPNSLAFQYLKLERYGMLLVFILLYSGLFQKMVLPVVVVLAKFIGVSSL